MFQVHLNISAIPLADGRFLPRFSFLENEGFQVTTVPYNFGTESIKDTKEEALKVAKTSAIQVAIERYGREAKIILSEE